MPYTQTRWKLDALLPSADPAEVEKAIAGSSDHDESIFSLSLQGKGVSEIYETLVVDDIRAAADNHIRVTLTKNPGNSKVDVATSGN